MPQQADDQCEDDRTSGENCDRIETMAKQVQVGENLLTACFEQEDRGETPDWEQVRGLPGINQIKVSRLIIHPASAGGSTDFWLCSLKICPFCLLLTLLSYSSI
jgi:hypothetical protein